MSKFCFVIGVILLCINIWGLQVSLRGSDLVNDENMKFEQDVSLSEKQFYQLIDRDFKLEEELRALTSAVSRVIGHYWSDEGVDKYHLRVPFYENYLLYLASFLAPEYYLKYEFMDHRRAVERGVGFCSQATIVLVQLLRERGVDSKVVGLKGHILATAPVAPGKWWMLDADYGVTMPFDLEYIERDTSVIEPYYLSKGYSREEVEHLKLLYKEEGNTVKLGSGIDGYGLRLYYVEVLAYFFKWMLPLTLLLPLLIKLYKVR